MLKVTSFTFEKHKKEDECQNTNGKRSFNRRCVDAIRTQLLDYTGVKKNPVYLIANLADSQNLQVIGT